MFYLFLGLCSLIMVLIVVGFFYSKYILSHPRCPYCGSRFSNVIPFEPYDSVYETYWCSMCGMDSSFLDIWLHNLK